MSRTKKHPYTGPRSISGSCRHGGTCDRCRSGRQHAARRRTPADAKDQAALATLRRCGLTDVTMAEARRARRLADKVSLEAYAALSRLAGAYLGRRTK